MSVNARLIAEVEQLAKNPHVIAIAREYDDILQDVGNVEATVEMVAMVMLAVKRVQTQGDWWQP